MRVGCARTLNTPALKARRAAKCLGSRAAFGICFSIFATSQVATATSRFVLISGADENENHRDRISNPLARQVERSSPFEELLSLAYRSTLRPWLTAGA